MKKFGVQDADKIIKEQADKLKFLKKARISGKDSTEMSDKLHRSIGSKVKEAARKRKIVKKLRGDK